MAEDEEPGLFAARRRGVARIAAHFKNDVALFEGESAASAICPGQ